MQPSAGDSHNFSQRVQIRSDGWVYKPRCLFWEKTFLSRQGIVREFLDEQFFIHPESSPLELAPDLATELSDNNLTGRIKALKLSPPSSERLNFRDFEQIGSVIALCVWLGITDLHLDNIAFGLSESGKLVFFPIDIECVFEDVLLPSQTCLIPNSHSLNGVGAAAGLNKLTAILSKNQILAALPAILFGFDQALTHLETFSANFLQLVSSNPHFSNCPIRVVPRATRTYANLLANREQAITPPLLPAEAEQLARGDIPYFFRFLNSDKIYHYVSKDFQYAESAWRANGDYFDIPAVKTLRSPLRLESIIQTPLQRKAGLLQLARFFDNDFAPVNAHHKGMNVLISSTHILITDPAGVTFSSSRKPPDAKQT